MSEFAGYARVLARARVQQEQQKKLLGKPFLRGGQLIGLAGYFLQAGALLGAKYRDRLDPFGPSFLGLSGEDGAMQAFVNEAGPQVVAQVSQGCTFSEFVQRELSDRL